MAVRLLESRFENLSVTDENDQLDKGLVYHKKVSDSKPVFLHEALLITLGLALKSDFDIRT